MEMLKYAVNKSLRLDLYQFSYLSSFAAEFSRDVKGIYNNPLWKKACSASDTFPLPSIVNELAMSLNIINSSDEKITKSEVCSRFYETTHINKEVYVDANKNRQRQRMDVELKGAVRAARDFESGFSSYRCSNTDVAINGDPLDYSDDSLVYYTDKDKKTWCFTPNTYNELLKKQVNYYTNERIPKSALVKMSNIITFMKSLSIEPSKIVSVSKAIEKLNLPDAITNEHTDVSINFVKNTTAIRGIMPQELDNLKFSNIIGVLELIQINPDYLYDKSLNLPYFLVFATLCKALHIFAQKYNDIERAERGVPTMNDIYGLLIQN
jgi:hypothetical protein